MSAIDSPLIYGKGDEFERRSVTRNWEKSFKRGTSSGIECVHSPPSFPAMFPGSRYHKSPRGNFTARSLLNLYRTSHYGAYVAWLSLLFPLRVALGRDPSRNVMQLSRSVAVREWWKCVFREHYLSRRDIISAHIVRNVARAPLYIVSFITVYRFLSPFFFYLVLRKRYNCISPLSVFNCLEEVIARALNDFESINSSDFAILFRLIPQLTASRRQTVKLSRLRENPARRWEGIRDLISSRAIQFPRRKFDRKFFNRGRAIDSQHDDASKRW